jgi:hypothetical protein
VQSRIATLSTGIFDRNDKKMSIRPKKEGARGPVSQCVLRHVCTKYCSVPF